MSVKYLEVDPCASPARKFPRSRKDDPVCRSCGGCNIGFEKGRGAVRDSVLRKGGWISGGFAVEPPEPAYYYCVSCGSEDIAKSRGDWETNYTGPSKEAIHEN